MASAAARLPMFPLVAVLEMNAIGPAGETSQSFPLKPPTHWHVRDPIPSMHVPPLRQGAAWHSSMFVAQVGPVNPGRQAQVAVPLVSEHVP
jgi:hypothetical protein